MNEFRLLAFVFIMHLFIVVLMTHALWKKIGDIHQEQCTTRSFVIDYGPGYQPITLEIK